MILQKPHFKIQLYLRYQKNSFKRVKNDLTFAPSLFFFHIIISSPNISFVFFGLFFTTAFQEIAIPSHSRKPLSILRVLDFELSTKYKADTLHTQKIYFCHKNAIREYEPNYYLGKCIFCHRKSYAIALKLSSTLQLSAAW